FITRGVSNPDLQRSAYLNLSQDLSATSAGSPSAASGLGGGDEGQDDDSQSAWLPTLQEAAESEPTSPWDTQVIEATYMNEVARKAEAERRLLEARETAHGEVPTPSPARSLRAAHGGGGSPHSGYAANGSPMNSSPMSPHSPSFSSGSGPGGIERSRSSPLNAWAENRGPASTVRASTGSVSKASMSSMMRGSGSMQEPWVYANGSPILKNRKSFMSLEQLFSLCKELKIFPDMVTRQAVVNIFKRSQCAGTASSHGGSNFGLLAQEAFVDAMGQIAIDAYSKEPYSAEYPSAHEKIYAFLLFKLKLGNQAAQQRALRERFHYGCSGRGPLVSRTISS
ncbi:unnamed protein product, partial [Polarella glacialis]